MAARSSSLSSVRKSRAAVGSPGRPSSSAGEQSASASRLREGECAGSSGDVDLARGQRPEDRCDQFRPLRQQYRHRLFPITAPPQDRLRDPPRPRCQAPVGPRPARPAHGRPRAMQPHLRREASGHAQLETGAPERRPTAARCQPRPVVCLCSTGKIREHCRRALGRAAPYHGWWTFGPCRAPIARQPEIYLSAQNNLPSRRSRGYPLPIINPGGGGP